MKYNDIENKIKQELQNQTPDWDKGSFWNDLEKELPVSTNKPWWRNILPIALVALVISGSSLLVYNQLYKSTESNSNSITSNSTLDKSELNKNNFTKTNQSKNNNIDQADKLAAQNKTIENSKPSIENQLETSKPIIEKQNESQSVKNEPNKSNKNNSSKKIRKTKNRKSEIVNIPNQKIEETVSTEHVFAKTTDFNPIEKVTIQNIIPTTLIVNTNDIATQKFNTIVFEKESQNESTPVKNEVESIQPVSVAVNQTINNKLIIKKDDDVIRLDALSANSVEANLKSDWSINTTEREVDFPVLKVKPLKQKKFSVEAYGGVGVSKRNLSDVFVSSNAAMETNPFSLNEDENISRNDLIDLRNTNEVQLENYKAGIRLSYKINKNIKVSTGIEFQQINEKFSYTDVASVNETIQSDSASYYIVDGQEFYFPGSLNGEIINTRNIKLFNNHQLYNIPLQLGYTFEKSKWNYEIYAGFGLNIYTKSNDKFIQRAFAHSNETFNKSGVNNIHAGFKSAFKLNNNIELTGGIQYDHMMNSIINNDDLFKMKYQLIGVQTGLRANF